jgi:sugar phosphate isomerase/epimerase
MTFQSAITVSLVPEARGGPFVFWDDLPAACKQASELGFEAIELFAPEPEAVNPRHLRMLLEDYNLKLAAVGTGAGWVKHQLLLTHRDPTDREHARDFVRRMIDLGGPFGASAIIGSMQGRHGPDQSQNITMQYLGESLQQLGEHAAQYQVPLIYEPLNRYETNLCNRLEQGAELLASLDRPNVKLLADWFHMNIEEQDLANSFRQHGNWVGHIHFADTNRRAVGFGHLDVRPIIAALREINYTGYLSAEVLPWPDSIGAAQQTIRAFREYTA